MRCHTFSLDLDKPEDIIAVSSGMEMGMMAGQMISAKRPAEAIMHLTGFALSMTGAIVERFATSQAEGEAMHIELINEVILHLQTAIRGADARDVPEITTPEAHIQFGDAPPTPLSGLRKAH